MNTRQPISDSLEPAVLNVQFGDDNQCFSAALENGFEIYTTSDCEVRDGRRVDNGIAICAMLEGSRYLALVGGGKQPRYDPDTLVLWCQRTMRAIQSREFEDNIVQVYIDKSHTLVSFLNLLVLQETPSNAAQEARILSSHRTAPNPYGLCCLGKERIVFLGQSIGQIWVVDFLEGSKRGDNRIIPAHTGPLRALCISKDEQLIATASEKGTIIRVFNAVSASKIAEFRRGVDPAIIFSLGFSPDSAFLAATSDKGTLHIFQIPESARMPARDKTPLRSRPGHSSLRQASAGSFQSHDDWDVVRENAQAKEHKWGPLASVPGAPRIFRDTYSTASCPFELGDEPRAWQAGPLGMTKAATSILPSQEDRKANIPVPGWPSGRPPKGVIGWLNDVQVYVIGGGQDALWQSFQVQQTIDNKIVVSRSGWKRFNRR